jgi:phosphonate ABC transporter permease subunit PhnE
MKTQRSLFRSVGLGLVIILVIVIYAYGFTVTDVNFETTRSETRITQLTRILRALAHPDLLEYDQVEVNVEAPIYLPCPAGGVPADEPDKRGPYLVLTPACAGPRESVQVEGYNFTPGLRGPINFIPPSGATLNIGNFTADEVGYFQAQVELPNRQPVEDAQTMRAISRVNEGLPRLSSIANSTLDKIIETVFLALLATTFGTLLAIPISFFAARNLMSEVKSPLTNVGLTIVGWPVGILLGVLAARWIGQLGDVISANTVPMVAGFVISPLAIWGISTWAFPQGELEPPSGVKRLSRYGAMVLVAGLGILSLYLLSHVGLAGGNALDELLGSWGFLGNFVFQLADILRMLTPVVTALAGGAALSGILGGLGQMVSDRMDAGVVKVINLGVAALAGAVLFALISTGIDWFNLETETLRILWGWVAVGAVLGLGLAAWAAPKQPLPIGIALYTVIRTLLNGTRSVEPLIMVIVFVVWVGIGPFAGALALGLHTIAALAKLFSEQVESILPGPLEAVRATGANRLQTIIYAVIPQIIPPYISFTMYRWDINVRMSTIIGFAGGGGIGFLLQQNIRLLDYRAASTQMLAIAIVVASMDYISSTLRERFV